MGAITGALDKVMVGGGGPGTEADTVPPVMTYTSTQEMLEAQRQEAQKKE